MAVGVYYRRSTTTNGFSLAEHWNGRSWQLADPPNPAGSTETELIGVSCALATSCVTVGNYTASNGNLEGLAEAWNGSNWTILAVPDPSSTVSLTGISCVTSTNCTAVGVSGTKSLAERWNGSSWKVESTPNPRGSAPFFNAVSCPTSDSCTAVGSYNNGNQNDDFTFAEYWNGSSWKLESTLSPNSDASLNAVSCPTSTSCTAVGNYAATGSTFAALAEHWNGTAWKIQSTPDPSSSVDLLGVSCPSATSCTAVGAYTVAAGAEKTLAEGWNGTRWSVEGTPQPKGSVPQLNGVSCLSPATCSAVGYFDNSFNTSVTLAEHE
jgi:hypothetical protein